ncbi:hypothetical protein RchiOBHm_Chr3g0480271 [Rosa chinensis]|uniref:Uncharacterized protein n=1 Tax=Rosa chinensis TaxID=74649 RepID=A0A2P6RDK3_ROSCH|nr:uncharacterized protein LOC112194362 [Rosa chinensis]PRQ44529.1 hypothetical protein RchiOBHm_Chr3g0480271 [Rosa chinensis]
MNFSEEKLMEFISAEYPYESDVHDNKLCLGELSIDLRLCGLSLTCLSVTMPYQRDVIASFVGHIDVYNADVDKKGDAPIFSCPVVGDSLVVDIQKPINHPFHVYLDLSETMKKLTISYDLEDVEMPAVNGKTVYKAADFSICEDKIRIFDRTCLEEIIICDASVMDYDFDGFIYRLERAHVGVGRAYMHYLDGADVASARALKLITELKNVRNLTLNMNTVGTLSCCLLNEESNLPIFSNLLLLEMEFHECFGWKLLFSFLESSPALQEVIIRKVDDDLENFKYKGEEHDLFTTLTLPQKVPSSLLTSIQIIEMTLPVLHEKDDDVYQYLVENGAAVNNVLVLAASKVYQQVLEMFAMFKVRAVDVVEI